ncbi:MAG: flagellar M-ring protein FliF C-terminal domain-containing protein [Kofleriaceae bacterium]
MAEAPKSTNQVFTVLKQLKELWDHQPRARRSLAILVVVGILGFVAVTSVMKKTETWTPVMDTLSPGDSTSLFQKLESRGIEARMHDGKVEVEDADIAQARAIGAVGLGLQGWDTFNGTNLGQTELQQQVMFLRAIQDELTRSILEMTQVSSARVLITFGHKSAIKDLEEVPSASVALIPRPGQQITPEQVNGIRAMVAATVGHDMDPSKVVVTGPRGEMSAEKSSSDSQVTIEQSITSATQSMLETMVGTGHVVVKTNVDFDRRKIQTLEESLTNDAGVKVSETRTVHGADAVKANASIGGVAGVQGNLPGGPAPVGAGSAAPSGDLQETINWAPSKKTTTTVNPEETIKKLHVAIIVDEGKDAKTGKPVARTKEELDNMIALARTTAGIDDARGDTLELKAVAFAPIEPPPVFDAPKALLPVPVPVAIGAGAGLLVVLTVVILLVKSRGKNKASKTQALVLKGGKLAVPMPVSELERVLDADEHDPEALAPATNKPGLTAGKTAQQRVMDVVRSDVERAAGVLTGWLAEPPPTVAKGATK